MTCRLEEKQKMGGRGKRREEGKGCSYIKTWWNSNKSVIEMNVQPLLPSTTTPVTVAEWREKTDLGLMTQEKSFMGGKSECFNASYVNCHLTGPNFSNTIDSWWWKDLVCLQKRKTRRAARSAVWITVSACPDSSPPNHKSHVFPMFLPSSPHSKPQRAYPACTSKPSLPVCWNFNYTPINLAPFFL